MAKEQYASPKRDNKLTTGLSHPSEHRNELLRFFHRHRTSKADLVRRAIPQFFDYDRKAIRQLDSLVSAGDILAELRPRVVSYLRNTGTEICSHELRSNLG